MSRLRASDFHFFTHRGVDGSKNPQFAALCYRVSKGKTQVLLITSRDTGRWVIPKGWPISGKKPHEAAAQEAWEEAGVTGKVKPKVLGIYSYSKHMGKGTNKPMVVAVFALKVKKMDDDFPEAGQRRRKWVSPKKAAARVKEPELAKILRNFRPSKLKR